MNSEPKQGTCEGCKHDRTGWPAGEWDHEPDRLEFVHAGLTCLIRREPCMGHLCGYVGVSRSHPLHGKGYNELDAAIDDLEVHGGLTFAEQREALLWFGFDCAHCGDWYPALAAYCGEDRCYHGRYRNLAYVRRETERLAEQLAAAASSPGAR